MIRRKQAVTEESPFAKAKAEEERQEEEKRKSAEARSKPEPSEEQADGAGNDEVVAETTDEAEAVEDTDTKEETA